MANHYRHHPNDEEEVERRSGTRNEESQISLVWRELRTLRKIVTDGNGEPSLTSKVESLEGEMEGVKKSVARVERIEWGILLGIVGIILSVIFKH